MTLNQTIEIYNTTLKLVPRYALDITRVKTNEVHGMPFELLDSEYAFQVEKIYSNGTPGRHFYKEIDEELMFNLCELAIVFNADWPRFHTGGKRYPALFVERLWDSEEAEEFIFHWDCLAEHLGMTEEFENEEVTTIEMMEIFLNQCNARDCEVPF